MDKAFEDLEALFDSEFEGARKSAQYLIMSQYENAMGALAKTGSCTFRGQTFQA